MHGRAAARRLGGDLGQRRAGAADQQQVGALGGGPGGHREGGGAAQAAGRAGDQNGSGGRHAARACAVGGAVRQSSGFRRTGRARTTGGPPRRLDGWRPGSSAGWSGAGAIGSPPTRSACRSGGAAGRAGLRREELAGLAGISADYLTRLEQGRATAPSAQVVEALARALRVSDAERDLLYQLAGHADARARRRPVPRHAEHPAPARPAGAHPGRRLRRELDAGARQRALRRADGRDLDLARARTQLRSGATWPARAPAPCTRRRSRPSSTPGWSADLRLTAARYPADRRLRRLIGRLAEQSPRFAELWDAEPPAAPREPSRRKIIDHPAVGRMTLDCDTLIVAQTTCASRSTPPSRAPRTPSASPWPSSSAPRPWSAEAHGARELVIGGDPAVRAEQQHFEPGRRHVAARNRATILTSLHPASSKWWCSGTIRKTRLPVVRNETIWITQVDRDEDKKPADQ